MRVEAALGLGANLGDPVATFAEALKRLGATGGVRLKALSSVWRTAPWGNLDQPEFRNMAVLIETGLSSEVLLRLCLAIEREHGRERRERWGPRTLDIDILTYGTEEIDRPGLQVPHPRIAERAFVLAPLAEIAPELVIGGQSVTSLRAVSGQDGVKKDVSESERLQRIMI